MLFEQNGYSLRKFEWFFWNRSDILRSLGDSTGAMKKKSWSLPVRGCRYP